MLDDTWLPRFVIDKEDEKQMTGKIWKTFPFNSNYWLIRLPPFIRILLGTKIFEKAMVLHFRLSCWHRTDKSCSICKNTIRIYPAEVDKYKELLKMASGQLEHSEEEIESQTSEEITFLRSIDRKTFEEAEESAESESVLQFRWNCNNKTRSRNASQRIFWPKNNRKNHLSSQNRNYSPN